MRCAGMCQRAYVRAHRCAKESDAGICAHIEGQREFQRGTARRRGGSRKKGRRCTRRGLRERQAKGGREPRTTGVEKPHQAHTYPRAHDHTLKLHPRPPLLQYRHAGKHADAGRAGASEAGVRHPTGTEGRGWRRTPRAVAGCELESGKHGTSREGSEQTHTHTPRDKWRSTSDARLKHKRLARLTSSSSLSLPQCTDHGHRPGPPAPPHTHPTRQALLHELALRLAHRHPRQPRPSPRLPPRVPGPLDTPRFGHRLRLRARVANAARPLAPSTTLATAVTASSIALTLPPVSRLIGWLVLFVSKWGRLPPMGRRSLRHGKGQAKKKSENEIRMKAPQTARDTALLLSLQTPECVCVRRSAHVDG